SKADPMTASKVVVLDSLISNIDRTAKNANLLYWHNELWVIDNGASFYFHHNWDTWESHLTRTFPFIKDHVLLQQATALPDAAIEIQKFITLEKVTEIVSKIPEDWLTSESDSLGADAKRAAYIQFITAKLSMIDVLVKEAEDAR
ncbi:MAG: HipA family kinase, partial [Maribacter stanieri]